MISVHIILGDFPSFQSIPVLTKGTDSYDKKSYCHGVKKVSEVSQSYRRHRNRHSSAFHKWRDSVTRDLLIMCSGHQGLSIRFAHKYVDTQRLVKCPGKVMAMPFLLLLISMK